MDLGLRDRVAIVTAASRGLGAGTVRALAAEGARVLINARPSPALDALTAEVNAGGGTALAMAGDITDPDVPSLLVDRALAEWGRLDIVVGNAGGPPTGHALEVTDEQILEAVNANLLASVRLARAAIPHLRERHWGRIVFIASATVRQPIRDLALSNVARTGLWAWTKTAAQELADDGITVNLAAPGLHLTDRLRDAGLSGRTGDPADFGMVVTFLCSEPAGFITSVALGVDGGFTTGLL